MTIQAKILSSSVSAALAFDDSAAAQQYLNALRANPELDVAAVYDRQLHVVANFKRARSDFPLPSVPPAQTQVTGNHITVVVPVSERGEALGRVYLRSSMESVRRRLLKYGVIALVAAMAAILLAVLGNAQRELANVNQKLKAHARDLIEANSHLQYEMRERAKIEDALRQSQKMEAVGQLSGGIAHDFNNFLMIIKGNLHLLKRRIAQGQRDVQRYVDGAIEGADRAALVTQRVLAFSRRQPLKPEPNNLSDLVRDALPLVQQSVGGRVTVEAHLKGTWWVYCDTNQMENVILNLAINARDAMPDGGRLTLATRDCAIGENEQVAQDAIAGEYVELLVSDTGKGMSEEVRTKALDPFFTTKPHGKGTGLGLSMSFGFVRQSAGHFEIQSQPDAGTTIRILLPRRYVDSKARRA
ncbi:MAG TPA: ATP-binding protein [Rhizomicrobium sp.]|nr:ATP-binding protein [Rhizomicrobium sp.]